MPEVAAKEKRREIGFAALFMAFGPIGGGSNQ
jgi:hypothetical protein